MIDAKAVSTTNLMLAQSKARTVIPSIDDLWESLPVEKFIKRYIDAGRGLTLLALRPSEKLKGVLGEDCLHDSRSSYYHHGDRRVDRPNLGNKPLSTPTDRSVGYPITAMCVR